MSNKVIMSKSADKGGNYLIYHWYKRTPIALPKSYCEAARAKISNIEGIVVNVC